MIRLLVVLVGLAGCDWSLHRMQAPVGCREHGATALLPGGGCELAPPDGVVTIDRPEPPPAVTAALLARGRDRFARICAACHGVGGDGDAAVARAMTLRRPPSLVDAAAASLSDQRITLVMTTGYGLMPGLAAVVTPRDRQAILHYLRALQAREVAWDELTPAQQAEARRWLP